MKRLAGEGRLPLYEYRCLKCGTQFEKIRKFSDPHLTKCEKCGGQLERLLSSPAFKFKGTGWHVTDYPSKSSPAEKEKREKEKTDAAPSGKNDKGAVDKSGKSSTGDTTKSTDPSAATKPADSKSRPRK
jgi:putative FmdB family regulatory protein